MFPDVSGRWTRASPSAYLPFALGFVSLFSLDVEEHGAVMIRPEIKETEVFYLIKDLRH